MLSETYCAPTFIPRVHISEYLNVDGVTRVWWFRRSLMYVRPHDHATPLGPTDPGLSHGHSRRLLACWPKCLQELTSQPLFVWLPIFSALRPRVNLNYRHVYAFTRCINTLEYFRREESNKDTVRCRLTCILFFSWERVACIYYKFSTLYAP